MRLAIAAGLLALLSGTSALAQTSGDVVVMRRTLATGNISLYEWKVSDPILGAPSCRTDAPVTYNVSCVDKATGGTVADDRCVHAAPARTGTMEDRSGCTYAWRQGGFTSWPSVCAQTATRTQVVQCVRSGSGTDEVLTNEAKCLETGARPASSETQAIYTACTHAWTKTSSVCVANQAFRDETYSCRRTHPNGTVDILTGADATSFCGPMPDTRVTDQDCLTPNVITNGDFETDTSGWIDYGSTPISITTQGASKGSKAAKMGTQSAITLNTHPAGTYEVSFTYLGSGRFWSYIGTPQGLTYLFNGGASAATITQFKMQFYSPGRGGYLAFENPDGKIIVDNIVMKRVGN